jgi:hypothetical protein
MYPSAEQMLSIEGFMNRLPIHSVAPSMPQIQKLENIEEYNFNYATKRARC